MKCGVVGLRGPQPTALLKRVGSLPGLELLFLDRRKRPKSASLDVVLVATRFIGHSEESRLVSQYGRVVRVTGGVSHFADVIEALLGRSRGRSVEKG